MVLCRFGTMQEFVLMCQKQHSTGRFPTNPEKKMTSSIISGHFDLMGSIVLHPGQKLGSYTSKVSAKQMAIA